jgi:hypothetical protein
MGYLEFLDLVLEEGVGMREGWVVGRGRTVSREECLPVAAAAKCLIPSIVRACHSASCGSWPFDLQL